jgi:hypothetical protein
MPNPIQPQAGTTPSTTTPETGTTPPGTTPETPETPTTPETPETPDEDDLSKLTPEQMKARLEKEISERQKANREAQTLRTRATTAEAKVKEYDTANMTELQKAQARVKELEEQSGTATTQVLNGKIIAAAAKAGFTDPNDAVALINRDELADDHGNIEDLLKKVLKDKPYLKGSVKTTTPAGGGGNPADQVTEAETKQKVEKATSQFSTIGRLAKMRGQ